MLRGFHREKANHQTADGSSFAVQTAIGIGALPKYPVVAACQRPGVLVAAIALMHKLNANLLRRWLEKAEGGATTTGINVAAMKPSAAAPYHLLSFPFN
jgi:hypothetical protein